MHRSIAAIAALFLMPAAAMAEPVPDCTPGIFELQNKDLRRDGSYTRSRATSTDYCGQFGDDLRLAEFRALDAAGNVVFRGLSLVVPSADRTEERVFWAMVGDPGFTTPTGRMVDGVLTHRGSGKDAMGTFEERSETRYQPDGSYRFQMDRRYGGSARWLKGFNIIDATRVAETPGPLPEDLALDHPAARGSGTWSHMGRVREADATFQPRHVVERRQVVLDGLAVVSRREHVGWDDQVLGVSYTFETVHKGRWRVLEWTPGGSVVERSFRSEGGDVIGRVDGITISETSEQSSRHRQISGDEGLREEWWLHPAELRSYGQAVPAQRCGDYAFLLGDFRMDASTLQPDRTHLRGVGFVSGQRLLEGRILSAEMHVMFMDGSGFRGTTLRSRDREGRWHVTWVAEGAPTSSSGISEPGTEGCVEVFPGSDPHGEFRSHLVLSGHDVEGFDVNMDNRYIGGPVIPGVWRYSARRLPR